MFLFFRTLNVRQSWKNEMLTHINTLSLKSKWRLRFQAFYSDNGGWKVESTKSWNVASRLKGRKNIKTSWILNIKHKSGQRSQVLKYYYTHTVTTHTHTSIHTCTQSTFRLWDNKLHLLWAVLHDLCCLAEGNTFQADVVQRDQTATCRQRSWWN